MTAPVFMGLDLSSGDDMAGVIYLRGTEIIARSAAGTCAVCGRAVCGHSDLQFAGLVPAQDGAGWHNVPVAPAAAQPLVSREFPRG